MNNLHKIYLDKLLSLVDAKLIQAEKFKVLVDPVNGAASEVLPLLLERLGCEVVRWNCETDRLPARELEPRKESLKETAAAVVKNHCHLGVATDMDADRVLFIDETGEVLSEDLVGAIFGQSILEVKKGVMVTPLNSSGLFKKVVEENGGKLVESLVGPPEISETVKKHRAVFAYEESGKYFFSPMIWADGLLATIKMLEIMARRRQGYGGLSQIRQSYPVYYQVKLAIKCAWDKMPAMYAGKGMKQVFGDSFRFIRASGTEPLIRVFSDSPSLNKAKELAEDGKKMVEKELSR